MLKEVVQAVWGVRDWMLQRAEEYETGLCQRMQRINGDIVDISKDEAVDLRTYARQLDRLAPHA